MLKLVVKTKHGCGLLRCARKDGAVVIATVLLSLRSLQGCGNP
jgi:hypothetical protein